MSVERIVVTLIRMDNSDPGSCPGYVGGNPISVCTMPSLVELTHALSLGSTATSTDDAVRVLLAQNSVVLRYILSREMSRQSCRDSPSLQSSLTTSGSLSGDASSPHSPLSDALGGCHADSADPSSLLCGSVVTAAGVISRMQNQPAKVFRCPTCPAVLNERDFDRHLKAWIVKAAAIDRAASKNCPGIRSASHPFLSHFPGGDFQSQVLRLVSHLRSLLRPGSNSANSPVGSGRHLSFAARILELWQLPTSAESSSLAH